MATSSSAAFSSDHRAPLAVVDADDHGAWVLICNAFGLTLILITLIIRIYVRVRVSPPFATDDFVLAATTALAIVQLSVVFKQVNVGFGKSIDLIEQTQLVEVQKVSWFGRQQ